MDHAFSCVLAAICVFILNGYIDSSISKTFYSELSGASCCNVYCGIALDLCDTAGAKRCCEIIGAVRRTIGHVDSKRIADSDLDRFLRIAGAWCNIDRVSCRNIRINRYNVVFAFNDGLSIRFSNIISIGIIICKGKSVIVITVDSKHKALAFYTSTLPIF